jgi:hypothetical protein
MLMVGWSSITCVSEDKEGCGFFTSAEIFEGRRVVTERREEEGKRQRRTRKEKRKNEKRTGLERVRKKERKKGERDATHATKQKASTRIHNKERKDVKRMKRMK